MNHSCDANISFEVPNDDFGYLTIARKDIKAGEELTNNYNSFIYTVHNPFDCKCGDENCFGRITGIKYLSVEQQKAIDIDKELIIAHNLDYLKK